MKTPFLETENFILKPVDPADAVEIFKNWTSDPEVTKYMRYTTHRSPEDTREWLANDAIANEGDSIYNWEFVLKNTREIIGTGGLVYKKDIDTYEIGYNIMKKYWHQGKTSEIAGEFVRFAKEELHATKLFGCHAKDNVNSGRVLQKLGFKYVCDGEDSKFDGSVHYETKEYELNL